VSRASAYAEIGAGRIGLVVDSYGLVSVCVDRGSAAAELGLDVGDAVTLSTPDEAGEPSSPPGTPVRLGRAPSTR
jgi:hypothetical protein